MKHILSSSTTNILAVMIIILGFFLLFGVLFLPTRLDRGTLTQVVSIDSSIMILAATYYFGASKQRSLTQQADNITNTPSPTETQSGSAT